MRYATALDYTHGLEADVGTSEIVEEPGASSQEEGHHVDLNLIYQSGREVLLRSLRSAGKRNVPASRRIRRLPEG